MNTKNIFTIYIFKLTFPKFLINLHREDLDFSILQTFSQSVPVAHGEDTECVCPHGSVELSNAIGILCERDYKALL